MKTEIIEGETLAELVENVNRWYADNPERYTCFLNGPMHGSHRWIFFITHIPTTVRLA